MSWNWRDCMGMSFASMLVSAGVWANFSGSSVKQLRGAWLAQANTLRQHRTPRSGTPLAPPSGIGQTGRLRPFFQSGYHDCGALRSENVGEHGGCLGTGMSGTHPAKRRPPRAKAHCARDLGSAEAGKTGRTTIAPQSTSKAIAGHFTFQSSNFSSSMTSVTTVLQSPAVR